MLHIGSINPLLYIPLSSFCLRPAALYSSIPSFTLACFSSEVSAPPLLSSAMSLPSCTWILFSKSSLQFRYHSLLLLLPVGQHLHSFFSHIFPSTQLACRIPVSSASDSHLYKPLAWPHQRQATVAQVLLLFLFCILLFLPDRWMTNLACHAIIHLFGLAPVHFISIANPLILTDRFVVPHRIKYTR